MPDTTDPAASALAEIRERWSKVAYVGLKPEVVPEPGHQDPWLPDVPRLLAALKDALKLAGDWDSEAVRLDAVVERSVSGGERATRAKAAAQAHKGCADALHEAITAALAGTQLSEDENRDRPA